MITNNFKKILVGCIFSSSQNGVRTPAVNYLTTLPTLISTKGEEKAMKIGGSEYASVVMSGLVNTMNNISTNGSNNTLYLKVGTGTTEATEDDYELATVNTDVSCDTVVVGISSNYKKTYTATFSNPTDSDITVTEVGLYGNIPYYHYGTPSYTDCLLDRTVLSATITIPAGESKTITYELGF